MAAVYTTRFGRGVSTASVGVDYTVPAGYRAVLTDLDIVFGGSTFPSTAFLIDTGPGAAFWRTTASSAGTVAAWRGRQVLEAGDTVQFFPTTTGISWHLTGYLFTLP